MPGYTKLDTICINTIRTRHLDATIVLDRKIASQGIYPAVDPLASTSRALASETVGPEHYDVARGVQEVLERFKNLKDTIAILDRTSLLRKTS